MQLPLRVCRGALPRGAFAPARTRLKDETLGSLIVAASDLPDALRGLRQRSRVTQSRAFDEVAERGGDAPHHAKCATIPLAKDPGSLVRFTFHGTHDRTCTCTVRGLKSVPLLIGLRGR